MENTLSNPRLPLEILKRNYTKKTRYEQDRFQELLPSELYIKIFRQVVKTSSNPLEDLHNIAKASNYFRQLIMHNPASVLCKLDLTLNAFNDEDYEIIYKLMKTGCDNHNKVEDLIIRDYYVSEAACRFVCLLLGSRWIRIKKLTIKGFGPDASKEHLPSPLVDILHNFIMKTNSLEELTIMGAIDLQRRNEFIMWKYLTQGLGRRLKKLILSQKMSSHIVDRSVLNNENCPQLRHLELHKTVVWDIRHLDLIGQQLESLSLHHCEYRQLYRIKDLPSPFKHLIELSMSFDFKVSSLNYYMYSYLAHGSKTLKKLDIKYCYIPMSVILNTPSERVEEFHMCHFDSNLKLLYSALMRKWRKTLRILCISGIYDFLLICNMLSRLHIRLIEKVGLGIYGQILEAERMNRISDGFNDPLDELGDEEKNCVLEQVEFKCSKHTGKPLIFGPDEFDSFLITLYNRCHHKCWPNCAPLKWIR